MIGKNHGSGALVIVLMLPLAGCAAAAEAPHQRAATPSAAQVVAGWPETAREAANSMIQKYGAPDEVTPTMVVWHDNGPWKRTIVRREEIQHDFPMPHKDVLEQFIDYDVPPASFDELAMYDGSVIAERTRGEISARCDKETANLLALNLAHDIVTGQRTVEEARTTYAEQMRAMMNNQPAPLTEGFTFAVHQGDITNPDQPHPILRGMR